ncbi:MAG: low-specificity L-threonine aldolase [Chloroflexi bacterium]|nr:low-specificity L-threonine aldolase [Chloroflexota bacterium]
MDTIDLRSDTVTQPTPEMRAAMAKAEVGDDVYGEDPTINALEKLAAERMGKEAALFVPSGTMGNLIALLVHCQRGDEVIVGDLAHPFLNETGGMAALGGIQAHTLRNQPDGTLKLEDIEGAIRADDQHHPITRLILLENTHNRCYGSALGADYIGQVGTLAKAHGLGLHIDGARLFNAATALGVEAKELVAAADSVTFCLSKGLCAPVGSVLCGSDEFIRKALRARKMLGGGMRQAGVLAAAGLIALETMTQRLGEDHARANALAEALREMDALEVFPQHTNIVRFKFKEGAAMGPVELLAAMKERGVLISWGGAWGMRALTHYWIDDAALKHTIEAFRGVLQSA